MEMTHFGEIAINQTTFGGDPIMKGKSPRLCYRAIRTAFHAGEKAEQWIKTRVEGLGNFGKPTGEFGTVEQANEDDALVKRGR
jgi:hypothetical protein